MTRSDANQKEIVKKWRKINGASYVDLHNVRNGCPDLLLGYGGFNFLIEVKSSPKATLTKEQDKFFVKWTGGVKRVNSFEDVIFFVYHSLLEEFKMDKFQRACILAHGVDPEKCCDVSECDGGFIHFVQVNKDGSTRSKNRKDSFGNKGGTIYLT